MHRNNSNTARLKQANKTGFVCTAKAHQGHAVFILFGILKCYPNVPVSQRLLYILIDICSLEHLEECLPVADLVDDCSSAAEQLE